MQHNNTYYHYQAYGLSFESEVPLFQENRHAAGPFDVRIRYGQTPGTLPHVVTEGVRYQASPEDFLLNVDRIARYHVSHGERIIVEPYTDAHENDIRLFLMGSAMGALLHQRHVLPLHASAVDIHGKCMLFTGSSGKGKSTLAAAFSKRGYPIVADDICAVSNNSPGNSHVMPGFGQIKLWEDILAELNERVDALKSVRFGKTLKKYYLPTDHRDRKSRPIHAVFVLDTHNDSHFKITPVTGMNKVEVLIENTYRVHFLDGFETRQSHFDLCRKTASAISVYHVSRPQRPHHPDLDALMDLVEEVIR